MKKVSQKELRELKKDGLEIKTKNGKDYVPGLQAKKKPKQENPPQVQALAIPDQFTKHITQIMANLERSYRTMIDEMQALYEKQQAIEVKFPDQKPEKKVVQWDVEVAQRDEEFLIKRITMKAMAWKEI